MPTISQDNVILQVIQRVKGAKQVEEAAKSTERLAGSNEIAQNAASKLFGTFRGAASAISPVVNVMKALAATALQSAGAYEKTAVAFEVFLGNAKQAQELLTELQLQSDVTPFEATTYQEAAKQLLAFGIEADKVTDTLRSLGEIAAGTNTGLGDLAFIYGQIRTQQIAYTEDLKQFAGRGIPIFETLAETLDVSVDKVRDLASEAKIQFPEIEEAFRKMTTEGGKFDGLMAKQSTTLEGLKSTLTGLQNTLFRTFGERFLLEPAKQATAALIDLTRSAIDFLRVPIDEKVEKERLEFNGLIQELILTNENQERRNELIDEINEKYPDLLGNLDLEKASLNELSDLLDNVNERYIAQAVVREADLKRDEAINKAATAQTEILERRRQLLERVTKAEETLANIREESTVEQARQGAIIPNVLLPLQARIELLQEEEKRIQDVLNANRVLGNFRAQEREDERLREIRREIKFIQREQIALNLATNEANELSERSNELLAEALEIRNQLLGEFDIQDLQNEIQNLVEKANELENELGEALTPVPEFAETKEGLRDQVNELDLLIAKLEELKKKRQEAADAGPLPQEGSEAAIQARIKELQKEISLLPIGTDLYIQRRLEVQALRDLLKEANKLTRELLDPDPDVNIPDIPGDNPIEDARKRIQEVILGNEINASGERVRLAQRYLQAVIGASPEDIAKAAQEYDLALKELELAGLENLLEAVVGENLDPALARQLQEQIALIRIEILKIKDDLQEDDPETRFFKKLTTDLDLARQAFQDLLGPLNEFFDQEERRINESIELQQERYNNAIRLADEGNSRQLELEEERLNALIEQKERYAQRQRALDAILIASNQAVSISEAIPLALEAFREGNIFTALAKVAAIIGSVTAITLAVSNAFSDVSFDKGTEFLETDPRGIDGKGGQLIVAHRGERILTAEQNKELAGIPNEDIPELVRMGQQVKVLSMGDAYLRNANSYADPNIQKQIYRELKTLNRNFDRFGSNIDINVSDERTEIKKRKRLLA